MRVLLWLMGSVRLCVPTQASRAVMNLCLQNEWAYRDFGWGSEGVSFRLPLATARALERACRERELPVPTRTDCRGLPFLLLTLLLRPGLAVGGLLAVGMMIASGLFVWDVRVSGNVTLTESEVEAALAECGFGVGSYLPEVKTGELEILVPMRSSRIAWMSVFLDGTVARVQVIEEVKADVGEDTRTPANLVAACDGQIEYLQLRRGHAVVTRGQAVKRGDLLVSGVWGDDTHPTRFTRAAGEVMARTQHVFEIQVPLSEVQKVYGESYLCGVSLKFFDFSVKFFQNSGNGEGMCDIIETEINKDLFGAHPLPVFLVAERAYPYEEVTHRRTAEEALALAWARLEHTLSALCEGAELLSKRIETELGEDAVRLICTVECIENIAESRPFEVVE